MSVEADSEKNEVEQAVEEKDKELKPAATINAVVKRRTKTGCLTCRKRRIKCGEEKPSCRNCIKSNRDCAGYKQLLVNKNHDAQMTHYYSIGRRTRSKEEHHQMKTTLNHYHHQPNQPQHDPCIGLQQVQYHPTRSGSQQHPQHFQYPMADPSNSHIGVSPLKTSVHRRHHSGHSLQEIFQQQCAPHYLVPQRHGCQDHWPLCTTPFEEQSQFYSEPEYASITFCEPYLSNGESCRSYPTILFGDNTSSRHGLEGHHPSFSSLAEDEQW